jgi:hypothetical protein
MGAGAGNCKKVSACICYHDTLGEPGPTRIIEGSIFCQRKIDLKGITRFDVNTRVFIIFFATALQYRRSKE